MKKRQAAVERIAAAHLASMGSTLAETLGESNRKRLLWLGLLASPLLFPVALPGMATGVGTLCILIALGLCVSQPIPLPRWLGNLELNNQERAVGSEVVELS